MSEKVKLPREVAAAIEACKVPQNPTLYSQLTEYSMSWANDFPGMHMDTIMKAIVNGYEVEQTPTEQAIQWCVKRNCIAPGYSPHDVVMAVKSILERKGEKDK